MENQTEYTQGQQANISDNALSFKVVLGKFMAFLPFFILSIFISLSIAFLVNRYATPKYALKATMLLKDKGRGSFDGAESFIQGSSLLMQSKNIENEMGLLKSRSLVEKVLNNVDFRISYFLEGNVKKMEMYKNLPFFIEVDSNHFQTYGVPIFIRFISNNQVELSTNNKSGNVLIPYNEQDVTGVNNKIENKVFDFTKEVESENFKFKITLFDKSLLNAKDDKYFFIINSKSSLLNKYANSYAIKTINKQSTILEISKESEYPEKDIDFINALCQTYINQGFDDKALISKNTINFINLQLNDLQDTLRNIEKNILDFKTNNKILSLGEEGKEVMGKLYGLEEQKAIELSKFKYYSYLYDYINKNKNFKEIIAPSTMGIQDPLLGSLIVKLMDLYARKSTYENSLKDANPAIFEIDQNIKNIKLSMIEILNNIKNQSQFTVNDINAQITEVEKDLSTIPVAERQFVNINRKYNISDKLYTYLLEKRAEAGIAGASVIADNKFVDKAIITEKVYPKTSSIYSIALAIGLILPLIIILINEFFSTSITNHQQLQAVTKIPLIGNIIHNTSSSALVIANAPKASISESFRNLRSNLNYVINDKDKKIILVTSTVSGEGKTFVSMNIASVIAIGGAKTLLIGVDLRKPKIFQDFNLNNAIGLTNYLIGNATVDQIIQKSGISNLDVITAGPTPPNPSELLMSAGFEKLLQQMKEKYDFIILDTPPVGLVADGLDLMRYADLTLYIVRQRVSQKNYLNLINDIHMSDKTKNVGLVFNDVNFAPVYGYGYGNGYGNGNGYGYGHGYGYRYGYGHGYGYGYSYGTYSSYGSENNEIDKLQKPIWKRLLGL